MAFSMPSARLRHGTYSTSPLSPATVTARLAMMSLTLPHRHTGAPSALSYKMSP